MATAALPSVYDAPQIDVFVPAPERQSRVVVFFRPLLVLPHVVVLWLIIAVGLVLTVLGWFAALALGRLPRWIASYQEHALEYYARTYAFAMLLDRRFPPFRWPLGGYPLATRVQQSRVGRASVLFRLIIMIPARIAVSLVFAGAAVAAPLIWLLVLVRGRMPAPVHYALACVLRYQIRFDAYALMVTSVYPHELLGDGVVGHYPEERDWSLPVTAGARRLVQIFVVLGLGYAGVMGYLGYGHAQQRATLASRNEVVSAYNELAVATQRFAAAATSCASSGSRLRCVQKAVPPIADALERFSVRIDSVNVPPTASSDQGAIYTAANDMATYLRKAAGSTAPADYVLYIRKAGTAGVRVDAMTRRLIADLH